MQQFRRYTTMWGEEIAVPWQGDDKATHKAAKVMVRDRMTDEQRAAYRDGQSFWVRDDQGRRHHMTFIDLGGGLLAR